MQIFFGLNLIFNGIMWALFTKALARGTSTTQVSIINTSSNFMITALLGLIIFSESLPPLWWVGAALLVAGNVIIGRREEEETKKVAEALDGGENGLSEEDGLLETEGEALEMGSDVEPDLEGKRKVVEEDILDLEIENDAGRRSNLI